jgi:hypothetical protein
VSGGHGDVPLIHLPLRCRCGSDQFGIIVGAVSAGKWQPAPAQPACALAMTAVAAAGRVQQQLIGIEGVSSRPVRRIVLRER